MQGGGTLNICVMEMCRLSGYHCHLCVVALNIKIGDFSRASCQSMPKGDILLDLVFGQSRFYVFDYIFHVVLL